MATLMDLKGTLSAEQQFIAIKTLSAAARMHIVDGEKRSRCKLSGEGIRAVAEAIGTKSASVIRGEWSPYIIQAVEVADVKSREYRGPTAEECLNAGLNP